MSFSYKFIKFTFFLKWQPGCMKILTNNTNTQKDPSRSSQERVGFQRIGPVIHQLLQSYNLFIIYWYFIHTGQKEMLFRKELILVKNPSLTLFSIWGQPLSSLATGVACDQSWAKYRTSCFLDHGDWPNKWVWASVRSRWVPSLGFPNWSWKNSFPGWWRAHSCP